MILGLTKQILVIDTETSSPVDLPKRGQYQYWADPDTKVLMTGVKWLGQDTEAVCYDHTAKQCPLPAEIVEAINAPASEVMLAAANCEFDRFALERLGYPTPPEKWLDILILAYMLGFSGRLNDVLSQVFPLSPQLRKDGRGTRCITTFSVHQTPWHHEPDLWDAFVTYCAHDAYVEELLLRWCLHHLDVAWQLPMIHRVLRQELTYRRINRRGVPVDLQAVQGAVKIKQAEERLLIERMNELTGLQNANSVAQLTRWAVAQGAPIDNLRAATVRDEVARLEALPPDEHTEQTRRLLQVLGARQELAKTSAKKYDALLTATSPDGRLRGGWQFYGASRTGRVAGRTLNPANLPRPKLKRPEAVTPWMRLGDRDALAALIPDSPLQTLSSAIRASLRAPEGKAWCVADLSSIESVGAAWLAGCDTITDLFFAGRDTYRTLAAAAENIPYEEVTKEQRTYYKPVCLAADTKVLTDEGWLRIVDITPQHRLWDGVEWVHHGGVIYKGVQPVISRGGVAATPDHRFLENGQWVSFNDLKDEYFEQDNGLTRGLSFGLTQVKPDTGVDAIAGGSRPYSQATSVEDFQSNAPRAPTLRVAEKHLRRLLSGFQEIIGFAFRTDFMLYATGAGTLKTLGTRLMGRGGLNADLSPLASLSNTLSLYLGGITRRWRSTDAITTKTMSAETCGSFLVAGKTSTNAITSLSTTSTENTPQSSSIENLRLAIETSAPSYERSRKDCPPSKLSPTRGSATARTYDILNAGPRNRFVVKTTNGTALAHNCLGGAYRLSAPGLVDYAAAMGVTLSKEESQRQIRVFRDTYHEVVHYWDQLQNAVVQAMEHPSVWYYAHAVAGVTGERTSAAGRVYRDYAYRGWPRTGYCYDGHSFLRCLLPSGRLLYYFKPAIRDRDIVPRDGGEPFRARNVLHYMGTNQKTGHWECVNVHNGLLLENVTQALCRDVLWEGLEPSEADPRFEVVGDVYDELWTLVDEGDTAALDRLVTHMTTPAPWMDERFYLGADGYVAKRYRKD